MAAAYACRWPLKPAVRGDSRPEKSGGTKRRRTAADARTPEEQPTAGRLNAGSPELKPWLARVAVLLCLVLILPYAEAVLLKPFLTRKLATLKADKGRLATIDRELDFLQSLKQSQPPYLDALFLFAKSAPPGTRFDSLTMDRQGQVSLHGTMQNGQQVTDFRSKLIASGFFSTVSVDEQTPSPDRQKVTLRMTAHWKPAPELARLSIGPTPEEIEQARTNVDTGGPGGVPPGMIPGMPVGMPMAMPGRNADGHATGGRCRP